MPRGGPRSGAGRPKGATSILPHGSVKAVKSLTIAPKGVRAKGLELSPDEQFVADKAFQKIVDVMDERVHPSAMPSVLKAATEVRMEILGERVKKAEVRGSLEHLLGEAMESEKE